MQKPSMRFSDRRWNRLAFIIKRKPFIIAIGHTSLLCFALFIITKRRDQRARQPTGPLVSVRPRAHNTLGVRFFFTTRRGARRRLEEARRRSRKIYISRGRETMRQNVDSFVASGNGCHVPSPSQPSRLVMVHQARDRFYITAKG